MPDSEKKTSSENQETTGSSNILNFEKQLSELEKIVADMERGDMSLEESLQAYERGVQLTRECQAALDSAQQRIHVLKEKNGVLTEQPFETES